MSTLILPPPATPAIPPHTPHRRQTRPPLARVHDLGDLATLLCRWAGPVPLADVVGGDTLVIGWLEGGELVVWTEDSSED